MQQLVNDTLNLKENRYFFFLYLLIIFLFMSCSKDDAQVEQAFNSYLTEGNIDLYTGGQRITYSVISKIPYVKYSNQEEGHDTLGYVYVGYLAESQAGIGSFKLTILNDMKLHHVEYVYPMSMSVGAVYQRWFEDIEQQDNSIIYSISENNGLIVGQLKGNLYYGGIDNSIAIDSCFFRFM